MYLTTELPNGLRIVTHEMKQRQSVAVGLWVGVGGRYETDKVKGAAHFLEHIVFKGSKNYSCDEIKENIEGVGGTLNAFTSEENTCYYAKIPSKHLTTTFDVLADMVFYPQIAAKEVNKEKSVICEEIKMYHDLPQYYVMELLDGLVWGDHPLGKSLAGSEESVRGISKKDLQAFHETHYTPQNIVISVCGDISHKKMVTLVKKKLAQVTADFKRDYVPSELQQTKARVHFYHKNTEQMHLVLGCEGYDQNHASRYKLSLLSSILGGNMSSRLFNEVREKRGLAYSISASSKTMLDTGLFVIRAGVDNAKIVEAVQVILKELAKIRRNGVKEKEFLQFREYLIGQLMLSLEDTMDHMLWIGESVTNKGRARSIAQIVSDLKKITHEDMKEVACDLLTPERMNLAVIGALTDTQKKSLNELLGLV